MYFIALEIERKGHVLGMYDNFEEGKMVWDRIEKLLDSLPILTILIYHKDEFPIIRTYDIKNELYISRGCAENTSDGVFSHYLIELGKKWKDLDSFITDRSFQTEMFLEPNTMDIPLLIKIINM